jgi:glyoxylase-like metal-dependent hydrolase (beta-lactamase superfamily II)
MVKKILFGIAIALVLLVAGFFIFIFPSFHNFMKTETVQFDSTLTIVLGGGGNSGILITDSAIVVIDTKMGKPAEQLSKLAKEKAGAKKIIVINTHYHGDHVNGNNFYKGSKIIIGNYGEEFLQKNVKPEFMPNVFVKDSMVLALGKDTIILYNLGQAHTLNDVVVYLKSRKLLFSGDLIFNKMNPVIKKESSADVDKWIKALENILAMNVNSIVPGHGKIGGKELASSLKQYFEDMKMAVAEPSKEAELIAKYSDWFKMPIMSSPEKTIEYLKSKTDK